MIINCEDCCSKSKNKLETDFTLEEQYKIKQYCEDLKIEWNLQYKQYEEILKYSTENKESISSSSFISQSEYKKNLENNNILEFNKTPEDNIKHLFSLIVNNNNNINNINNNNRFQYYNNNNKIIKYIKEEPKIILCYVNKKIIIGIHIID